MKFGVEIGYRKTGHWKFCSCNNFTASIWATSWGNVFCQRSRNEVKLLGIKVGSFVMQTCLLKTKHPFIVVTVFYLSLFSACGQVVNPDASGTDEAVRLTTPI